MKTIVMVMLWTFLSCGQSFKKTANRSECNVLDRVVLQGFDDSLVLMIPRWLNLTDTSWNKKQDSSKIFYSKGNLAGYGFSFTVEHHKPDSLHVVYFRHSVDELLSLEWHVKNYFDSLITFTDNISFENDKYRINGTEARGIKDGYHVYLGQVKKIKSTGSFYWLNYRYGDKECTDTLGILRHIFVEINKY